MRRTSRLLLLATLASLMALPLVWAKATKALQIYFIDVEGGQSTLIVSPLGGSMLDTGWPHAPLDDYIELWDHDYWHFMRQIPPERKLLDILACFQVAHGSGIRPEAILLQKIMNFSTLGHLLTSVEEYDPTTWPGTYMTKGLDLRDQWESKLLRTSNWSPMW